jgi:hypothetical protein
MALRVDEHERVRRDAAIFAVLDKQVKETFLHRDESKDGFWAWKEACRQFHEFDCPMFELLSEEGKQRIRNGDVEYVERAICYLEVDPMHFRSGYNKVRLISCLKWAPLSSWQETRLRAVVFHAVDSHFRTEFRAYCRLAARVQTDEFADAIRERVAGSDEGVRVRASFVLTYLDQHNRSATGKRAKS